MIFWLKKKSPFKSLQSIWLEVFRGIVLIISHEEIKELKKQTNWRSIGRLTVYLI